MTGFNLISEIPADIEVTFNKDGPNIRIGDEDPDTLGVNKTEDDFSIKPDWTDRRFTLAVLASSAFFHVTEEGEKEWKREEVRHLSHEGLIAEFYLPLRNIGGECGGTARPITMFEYDVLYRWDLDEVQALLKERGGFE